VSGPLADVLRIHFGVVRVKKPDGLRKLDEQPMRVGRCWAARYTTPDGTVYERIREPSGAVSWWRAALVGEETT